MREGRPEAIGLIVLSEERAETVGLFRNYFLSVIIYLAKH